MRAVPAFIPEALMASQVGTWQTDFAHGRMACDAVTANLFGLGAEQAEHGFPLTTYTAALHPDDVSIFSDKMQRMRRAGGICVAEYRVCPVPGAVRWILARGHYVADPATGRMDGRGIVIDITDGKRDGHLENQVYFVKRPRAETSLERAADLAMAARRAIDAVGGSDGHALRHAVDALLWAIGRALARPSDDRS
jgi:hypothetical protein